MVEGTSTNDKKEPPRRRNSLMVGGQIAKSTIMQLSKLDKREYLEMDTVEWLRVATKKFLNTSITGIIYQNLLLAFSLFSCLQCIYQTYLVQYPNSPQNSVLDIMEKFLAVLFGFDWCLSFLIADRRYAFMTR